ncbi:diacylglycerol kinase family protein [Cerasibacillus sp. JNUCC 74]|uniref:diacylglycerol kinase family protein n=1 Tax=Virgibacillus proomii TaxID=84407 RepID=UPI001FE45CD8|nr:diacylglycerol kinase family protein [Virgibacillus proomii]
MKGKQKFIGFAYAWQGILFVIRNERNFQLHLLAAVIVILAGTLLHLSMLEWVVIIVAITNVLITEMINSALEAIMDYLSLQFHPAIKKIKDMAAGAVLIAAIAAAAIGCIIFIPKIISIV